MQPVTSWADTLQSYPVSKYYSTVNVLCTANDDHIYEPVMPVMPTNLMMKVSIRINMNVSEY